MSCAKLEVSCEVSGCYPAHQISLAVSGSFITARSVSNSSDTCTATATVTLPDSAAIQCMVAVPGTNYTATARQYYSKYVAVNSYSNCQSDASVGSILIVLFCIDLIHLL